MIPGRRPGPKLYAPFEAPAFAGSFTIVARTSGEPAELSTAMRTIAHDLAPAVPAAVSTMQERMELPQWMPKTLGGFFGVCGLLALVLATIGLFGVTHVVVSQRSREFGELVTGPTGLPGGPADGAQSGVNPVAVGLTLAHDAGRRGRTSRANLEPALGLDRGSADDEAPNARIPCDFLTSAERHDSTTSS
jgi:hypothetical protein